MYTKISLYIISFIFITESILGKDIVRLNNGKTYEGQVSEVYELFKKPKIKLEQENGQIEYFFIEDIKNIDSNPSKHVKSPLSFLVTYNISSNLYSENLGNYFENSYGGSIDAAFLYYNILIGFKLQLSGFSSVKQEFFENGLWQLNKNVVRLDERVSIGYMFDLNQFHISPYIGLNLISFQSITDEMQNNTLARYDIPYSLSGGVHIDYFLPNAGSINNKINMGHNTCTVFRFSFEIIDTNFPNTHNNFRGINYFISIGAGAYVNYTSANF